MKQNGSEKLPSFSLWNEIKRNRSEKKPSISFRSEMESKFFRFDVKVFFSLVFASEAKRKWNEVKTKRKNFYFVSLWSETKRSKAKRKSKRKNFGSETKRKYALLISLWSEAKKSKRKEANKFFFFTWACETDLVSLRFALKRKNFWRNRRTLLASSVLLLASFFKKFFRHL
jgi:hypothetical protein